MRVGKSVHGLRGLGTQAHARLTALRHRSARLMHLRRYGRAKAAAVLTVGVKTTATYAARVQHMSGSALPSVTADVCRAWAKADGRNAPPYAKRLAPLLRRPAPTPGTQLGQAREEGPALAHGPAQDHPALHAQVDRHSEDFIKALDPQVAEIVRLLVEIATCQQKTRPRRLKLRGPCQSQSARTQSPKRGR